MGRSLGEYFSREGKKKIVIGKDTRLSSDMLEAALAAGIASEGCDAYLTGYGKQADEVMGFWKLVITK